MQERRQTPDQTALTVFRIITAASRAWLKIPYGAFVIDAQIRKDGAASFADGFCADIWFRPSRQADRFSVAAYVAVQRKSGCRPSCFSTPALVNRMVGGNSRIPPF